MTWSDKISARDNAAKQYGIAQHAYQAFSRKLKWEGSSEELKVLLAQEAAYWEQMVAARIEWLKHEDL